jgi:hypothetical protein
MVQSKVLDLELSIHRSDPISFTVELRADRGGADAETAICAVPNITFDFAALRRAVAALDYDGYGKILTKSLFGHADLEQAFITACARADEQNADVRLRLFITPTAVDLHRLRWEMLLDPRNDDNVRLVTNEKILFSRYLSYRGFFSGEGWRDVGPRTRADLRPLTVIANPSDLASFTPGGITLEPIPVVDELERVRKAFNGKGNVVELASGGKATLGNLVEAIRDGCNIVYLVCHGVLIAPETADSEVGVETAEEGEAHLYLEKPDGTAEVVPATELLRRLRELPQVPRLILLASCQSGGREEGGAFHRAVGPRLAEIGVPAVIAMHGNVAMDAVAAFVPKFLTEIRRSGEVDRAVAAARGDIGAPDQIWKPMLFMRLRSGRLWPGTDLDGPKSWDGLVGAVETGNCVPILGPGTYEALVGSRREMALRWAREKHFPMAAHAWNDLAQVAQYLAVMNGPAYVPHEYMKTVADEVTRRYSSLLAKKRDQKKKPTAPLDKILQTVGKALRKSPNDLYRMLAELPCPLYLTTNPSNLLFDALREAGKKPVFATFPWTESLTWPHSPGADPPGEWDVSNPAFRPDLMHPLVYHVFGHLDEPKTLVLSEDDIFDYLIGFTRHAVNESLAGTNVGATTHPTELQHIRTLVNQRLVSSSLLFLGFPSDDWTFRVLLRTIVDQPGSQAREDWPQIAVQVDPDDELIEDIDAAREYMKDYLQKAGDIELFWSGIEEFVMQLHQKVVPDLATR